MLVDPNECFAPNREINTDIHRLLAKFSDDSCKRMIRKIKLDRDASISQGNESADAQARHTFREFLVAERLNDNGYSLEYSPWIGQQTSDWYDSGKKTLLEVFTCERGGTSCPRRRVATRLGDKVSKYKRLVETDDLIFVIAVHGDFFSNFDSIDCKQAIDDWDVFAQNPDLSGVIFFAESEVERIGSTSKQLYEFTYFQNPSANRPVDLTPSLLPCA